MVCIHHVRLGYIFKNQCKLKTFGPMCHQKYHLDSCGYMQHHLLLTKMAVSIALR